MPASLLDRYAMTVASRSRNARNPLSLTPHATRSAITDKSSKKNVAARTLHLSSIFPQRFADCSRRLPWPSSTRQYFLAAAVGSYQRAKATFPILNHEPNLMFCPTPSMIPPIEEGGFANQQTFAMALVFTTLPGNLLPVIPTTRRRRPTPPFCNTPSPDGPQLTTTPHAIKTHH